MINANELRIGNIVFIHNKISLDQTLIENLSWKEHTIQSTDIVALSESDMWQNFYQPMPITNDLLIRLGWVHEGQTISRLKIDTEFGEVTIWLKEFVTDTVERFGTMPLCKYVHQLQNIYYSLTGIELSFNH